MADKLQDFFNKRKQSEEVTPLMLDEDYLPKTGTVTFDPQDPSKGTPLKGGYINPQGKPEAKIPGMGVEGKLKAKSVAKPISEEMIETAESAPKVDQQALNQIIASMRTQPTQMPAPQPQAPASLDGIDLKAIRQKVANEGESASLSDFLVGLIPVALDAATGGQGHALGGAGDYYTGKAKDIQTRNRTLEDKLMDYQKTRAVASAKGRSSNSFQSVNIVDPATQMVVKANYNKSTGEYTTPDGIPLNSAKIQAGYSVIPSEYDRRTDVRVGAGKELKDYTPRKNEQTGLTSRIVENEFVPIGSQKTVMNPKQEKDLDIQIGKFLTTDLYKKNSASIQSAATVDGLIRDALSGNATAANVARSEIAKIAEGGGRLTDQDVERVGGPQDYRSKIRRFKNLQNTGEPLLESDIAGLKQVAKTISDSARLKLSEALMEMETANMERGGVKGTMGTAMAPYIPQKESLATDQFPMTVRKGGKSATVSSKKELKEARSEGWK
jgi:hypothetical protein